jgi:OFA family oxalate/formate antiporter-like MFS transporter
MGTNTPSQEHELIRNWPILVVAFVLVFLAFGIPTYSLPFMYGPAMKEFGWSNAEVNLLSTAKFVIGAVAALGMGILVDRIGGRLAVLIGAATGGVAMAMFLLATNLPVYYLAGAMLGFSASSIVAAMKIIISRLCTLHQGAAMGIVLTATSTGGVVMPWIWLPLLQAGWNWRVIIAMMSVGPVLIAVPLWIIFVAMSKKLGPTINAPTVIQNKLSTWEHFKLISSNDRNFWLIAIGIFLVSAVDQAVQQNTVQFLIHNKGMNIDKIEWAASLTAVLGVAAKILSGWFYDRTSIRGIRFFYVLLALSTWLIVPIAGPLTLALFVITRGMAHGGMIVDVPILTRHYFGPERLGLTIGIMSVAVNLGFAAGPPVLGLLADVNHGSFVTGMWIYGAVAAVAVISLLRVSPRFWVPPSKRREQEALAQVASNAVPPTA